MYIYNMFKKTLDAKQTVIQYLTFKTIKPTPKLLLR